MLATLIEITLRAGRRGGLPRLVVVSAEADLAAGLSILAAQTEILLLHPPVVTPLLVQSCQRHCSFRAFLFRWLAICNLQRHAVRQWLNAPFPSGATTTPTATQPLSCALSAPCPANETLMTTAIEAPCGKPSPLKLRLQYHFEYWIGETDLETPANRWRCLMRVEDSGVQWRSGWQATQNAAYRQARWLSAADRKAASCWEETKAVLAVDAEVFALDRRGIYRAAAVYWLRRGELAFVATLEIMLADATGSASAGTASVLTKGPVLVSHGRAVTATRAKEIAALRFCERLRLERGRDTRDTEEKEAASSSSWLHPWEPPRDPPARGWDGFASAPIRFLCSGLGAAVSPPFSSSSSVSSSSSI